MPTPKKPNGLGLGFGLNRRQQQGLATATAGGTLDDYLAGRHQLRGRLGGAAQSGNTAAQGLLDANRSNQAAFAQNQHAATALARAAQPPAAPAAPTAPPGQGGKKDGQATASPPGPPKPGEPPTTMQQGLDAFFGAGNPFGTRGNYSDPNNPIYAGATRNYERALAEQRARLGQAGLGNSSRAALMEGEAASDYGANIAQIGEQAFQSDAGRALQSLLGAGQLTQGNNQLALQANQQLAGLGQGLTGIGAQEQGIPNLGELLGFLGAFQSIAGRGSNRTKGQSGWAYK